MWPSIDSVDHAHHAFQVWCFSHVCFWSYSLSKVKFGHSYVRQILCIIGRRSVLLLWGNCRRVFSNIGKPHDPAATHPILVVVAASSTERCRWMSTRSRHLWSDSGFLHIFSVYASNRFLGLWCRIHWNVQVLRSTMVKVRCLCVTWFSLIWFPTLSAYCWYLTLAFKAFIALARAVTDTHTRTHTHTHTHTQWLLEPHPCMDEVNDL